MIEVRIPRPLYGEMLADLRRRHSYAGERVGFAFGKLGDLSERGKLVLFTRYRPLDDLNYVDDPTVGAMISEQGMAEAMSDVYKSRRAKEGIFHVHLHEHIGPTRMSRTDSAGLPPMIPGFASISGSAPHGILILSKDHGSAWVRVPGEKCLEVATRIVIVGAPLAIFEEEREW